MASQLPAWASEKQSSETKLRTEADSDYSLINTVDTLNTEDGAGTGSLDISEMVENVMPSVVAITNKSVQEVLEYVNGNYQDSLTLGTFCEQKHYSVAYISRRFKQETGVTLREYVQNVRIKKSCELLEDSDLRVVEIARRVGYEDIKFFNQIFKRRMQISPREYRKICMNRAADG